MRCTRARKQISHLIDGNIAARERTRLKKHLACCPDCGKLFEEFQKIASGARELEKLSPSPRVWLKIKERLQPEEQRVISFEARRKTRLAPFFSRPHFKWVLSAALLLVAIIAGLTVGLLYRAGEDVLKSRDPRAYALIKLDEAEAHYQKAIEALMEAVSGQEGHLDSRLIEVFQTNLRVIDATLQACRQAVLQEPGNIDARNILLAAYRGKLDFLQGMVELQQEQSLNREAIKI